MYTVNVFYQGKLVVEFFSNSSNEITNHLIAQELLYRDHGISAKLAELDIRIF